MLLKTQGERYFSALKQFGIDARIEPVLSLLAPVCKKWMNGTCASETRTEIQQQLLQARAASSTWEMELHKAISGEEASACTIKYTISAVGVGAFMVMAILSFDRQGLITDIDEVFHSLG